MSETSIADVVRSAREAVGAPTLTRESVDAANAAVAEAKIAADVATEAADAKIIADAVVQPEEKPAEAVIDGEKAQPVFKSAYVSDDGVIYLIGAFAGNVDLDDDVLQTKALVDMAYQFCSSEKRTFKCNHKDELAADLVASMPGAPILKSGKVLKFGEQMPEDDEIVGICLKSEPICWFVGVRPHDKAVAEKAKAGEIVGSSWGAFVDRVDL